MAEIVPLNINLLEVFFTYFILGTALLCQGVSHTIDQLAAGRMSKAFTSWFQIEVNLWFGKKSRK
jgi:Ca2+/Na+ antiporter